MISNDSQIYLTLVKEGSRILRNSVIESAVVEVVNPQQKYGKWTEMSPIKHVCSTGEELHIKRAARVIKDAEYEDCVVKTTLGSAFVEYALQRPSKPRNMNMGRFLRSEEGKAYQNWNKMSNIEKLEFRVNEYALSQSCTVKNWELL